MLDTTKEFAKQGYNAAWINEYIGILLSYSSLIIAGDAKDLKSAFELGYGMSAGFTPRWTVGGFEVTPQGVYEYPDDAPLYPLAMITAGNETIYIYEYAIVVHIDNATGIKQFGRFD